MFFRVYRLGQALWPWWCDSGHTALWCVIRALTTHSLLIIIMAHPVKNYLSCTHRATSVLSHKVDVAATSSRTSSHPLKAASYTSIGAPFTAETYARTASYMYACNIMTRQAKSEAGTQARSTSQEKLMWLRKGAHLLRHAHFCYCGVAKIGTIVICLSCYSRVVPSY